jgi:hypothetical protein
VRFEFDGERLLPRQPVALLVGFIGLGSQDAPGGVIAVHSTVHPDLAIMDVSRS